MRESRPHAHDDDRDGAPAGSLVGSRAGVARARRTTIRAPIEMTRPHNRDADDAPSVYARLAAQIDIVERARPVPGWVPWVGRAVAIAIIVVAVVGVVWGHGG